MDNDDVTQLEDDAVENLLIAVLKYTAINSAAIYFIWWLIKPLFK